jgi:hypothetical protein
MVAPTASVVSVRASFCNGVRNQDWYMSLTGDDLNTICNPPKKGGIHTFTSVSEQKTWCQQQCSTYIRAWPISHLCGSRHHISIRVHVVFDKLISIGHRKRLSKFPKKKKNMNHFAVYLAFSWLSGVDTRKREREERERKTSNRSKTKTAIAHRKSTFSSSLTKGEGTYLSSRNHVSFRVKVILDQIVSVGHRRDLPPLPKTTSSVHFLSDHYLISHFFSTKHWSANSQSISTGQTTHQDSVKKSGLRRVLFRSVLPAAYSVSWEKILSVTHLFHETFSNHFVMHLISSFLFYLLIRWWCKWFELQYSVITTTQLIPNNNEEGVK